MDKYKNNCLAEDLAEFLLKLNEGKESPTLRKRAVRLITSITPTDIAQAESKLAQSGLPVNKIQQLSALFISMGIFAENGGNLNGRLPANHILRKVMAEHEMIRCFVADVEELTSQIQQKDTLAQTSGEFMRLSHIVEHLNSLEEHMDRENDVLFPALREQGWKSLFDQIEHEHTYIQMSIRDLVKLTMAFDKMPFTNFKTRLLSTVNYLAPLLREHMFREDRAIFPLAISMVQNEKTWDKLREICNEIDYCGIHL